MREKWNTQKEKKGRQISVVKSYTYARGRAAYIRATVRLLGSRGMCHLRGTEQRKLEEGETATTHTKSKHIMLLTALRRVEGWYWQYLACRGIKKISQSLEKPESLC